MTTCYATKLANAVSAGNLSYLNEFRIHIGTKYTATNDTQQISFGLWSKPTSDTSYWNNSQPFVIKVEGTGVFKYRYNDEPDTSFSGDVTTVTVPSGKSSVTILCGSGTYDIVMLGKNFIRNISYGRANANSYRNISFDISQLDYVTIKDLWTSGFPITGVFKPKYPEVLVSVELNRYNINAQNNPAKFSGGIDLDALEGAVNMTTLACRDTSCVGSIEKLKNCKLLSEMSLSFTDVTGEITKLAEDSVAAGRTSGCLQLGLIPSACTYNGTIVSYALFENHWTVYVVFSSSETGGYRIQYTHP